MKRIQLEPWTTWEKLCLANAVQRTGDQNWTAVGRVVKNIYDDTMVYLGNETRPAHWFSMKQCAAQYETLLNNVLSSRRKKRTEKSADPHEQPSNIIYNILKNEFLEELDRKIDEDKTMYKKMKKKQEDILAGLYDDKLQDMLASVLDNT